MTLVVDASTVVAALVDQGTVGWWAEELCAGERLAAPHLMPAEVLSALRRTVAAGQVSTDVAAMALADLSALDVELFAFDPFARRAWALRHNVTSYDAWYVALAESIDAPLATLDQRLAMADGPTCAFRTPG